MDTSQASQFPISESARTREEPISQLRPEANQHEPHQFSITIGREPQEVFAFWRDFKNLPLFMKDLAEVQILSEKTSRWVVKLKSGFRTEWDAEIVEELPGQMIAWQSLEGSSVETSGRVWFLKSPGGRGTIVRLMMSYHVPGGKLAELAGKFTGEDPYNLTLTNLRRLKAYLETGEIPTTEGQPSGRDEDLQDKSNLH